MKKKAYFISILIIAAFLTTIIPVTQANVRARPPTAGNKKPRVTITNPADGSTVSGVVTITVTATDKEDGDLIADIYINGDDT